MKTTAIDKLKKQAEDAEYKRDIAKIALRYEADTPAKKEKLKKRVAAWEEKLQAAKTALKAAKSQEKQQKEFEKGQRNLEKLRQESYKVTKKQQDAAKVENLKRLDDLTRAINEARLEGENTNTIGISEEAKTQALSAIAKEKKHIEGGGKPRSYAITYTHLFKYDSDSNRYKDGPQSSTDARIGELYQTTAAIMAYNGLVDTWQFQPIFGELKFNAMFRGEPLRGEDGSLLMPIRQKGLSKSDETTYQNLIKSGRKQDALDFYHKNKGKK